MDTLVDAAARWHHAATQSAVRYPGAAVMLFMGIGRYLVDSGWAPISIYAAYLATFLYRLATKPKPRKVSVPRSVPYLIGINGYAGTGKDTIGAILAERYGAKCLAFADALRNIASILNPVVGEQPDGRELRYNDALALYGYERCKKELPKFRPFLVSIGRSCRETVGENVWLDAVLPARFLDDKSTERVRVYTDARHKNECDRISRRLGRVLRVERPGVGPADETEAANVASVTPDITIVNDGTKEQLERAVVEAVEFEGRETPPGMKIVASKL